jgi:hypothetical protein
MATLSALLKQTQAAANQATDTAIAEGRGLFAINDDVDQSIWSVKDGKLTRAAEGAIAAETYDPAARGTIGTNTTSFTGDLDGLKNTNTLNCLTKADNNPNLDECVDQNVASPTALRDAFILRKLGFKVLNANTILGRLKMIEPVDSWKARNKLPEPVVPTKKQFEDALHQVEDTAGPVGNDLVAAAAPRAQYQALRTAYANAMAGIAPPLGGGAANAIAAGNVDIIAVPDRQVLLAARDIPVPPNPIRDGATDKDVKELKTKLDEAEQYVKDLKIRRDQGNQNAGAATRLITPAETYRNALQNAYDNARTQIITYFRELKTAIANSAGQGAVPTVAEPAFNAANNGPAASNVDRGYRLKLPIANVGGGAGAVPAVAGRIPAPVVGESSFNSRVALVAGAGVLMPINTPGQNAGGGAVAATNHAYEIAIASGQSVADLGGAAPGNVVTNSKFGRYYTQADVNFFDVMAYDENKGKVRLGNRDGVTPSEIGSESLAKLREMVRNVNKNPVILNRNFKPPKNLKEVTSQAQAKVPTPGKRREFVFPWLMSGGGSSTQGTVAAINNVVKTDAFAIRLTTGLQTLQHGGAKEYKLTLADIDDKAVFALQSEYDNLKSKLESKGKQLDKADEDLIRQNFEDYNKLHRKLLLSVNLIKAMNDLVDKGLVEKEKIPLSEVYDKQHLLLKRVDDRKKKLMVILGSLGNAVAVEVGQRSAPTTLPSVPSQLPVGLEELVLDL